MELSTVGIVLFCFGVSLLVGVAFLTLICANARRQKPEA